MYDNLYLSYCTPTKSRSTLESMAYVSNYWEDIIQSTIW